MAHCPGRWGKLAVAVSVAAAAGLDSCSGSGSALAAWLVGRVARWLRWCLLLGTSTFRQGLSFSCTGALLGQVITEAK